MKRFIALTLVALMALVALAGCSSLKEDEKGANISVYMSAFPNCLDPAVVQTNADVTQIFGLIYEGLTAVDENGKVVGALAEDWYYEFDNVHKEHKMFFELRSDAYWNDGRKVSADDIVYAWKRILEPGFESPYASLLFPIENAKAYKNGSTEISVDDLGISAYEDELLCITFERRYDEDGNDLGSYDIDLFAEQVSCIGLVPLREDIITDAEKNAENGQTWDDIAASIVCNGPYGVKNLEEGIRLVLERNSSYGRETDQALDKAVKPYRITITYQPNTIDGKVEEPKSEIDFQMDRFDNENIFFMSAFNKDSYAVYSEDVKDVVDMMSTYVYYFNTENELLASKEVRQALSMALDREKIVSEVTGSGEKAVTGYVPTGVFNTGRKNDFREVGGDLYSTGADTDKAKELLSGAKKGTIKIAYLIPDSKDFITDYRSKVKLENVYQLIAEHTKGVWEELGYTVELEGLYEPQYREALSNRTYDVIGVTNVVNSVDAYAWLSPFASRYSGCKVTPSLDGEDTYTAHQTNWENEEYDAIMDKVCYENDREIRAELLHEAEKILADECPATALFRYTNGYVKSGKLSGIGDTFYFGYRNFNDLSLKGWREINAAEEEASNAADDGKK